MSGEPILDKAPPMPHWDYRLQMTWPLLLTLRTWAQGVADAEDVWVYLVGSVLSSERPRDLDLALVLPLAEFERRFGPIPTEPDSDAMYDYLDALREWQRGPDRAYEQGAMRVIAFVTRVDLKVCPDTWWSGKARLLLAEPRRARL